MEWDALCAEDELSSSLGTMAWLFAISSSMCAQHSSNVLTDYVIPNGDPSYWRKVRRNEEGSSTWITEVSQVAMPSSPAEPCVSGKSFPDSVRGCAAISSAVGIFSSQDSMK